MDSQNPFSQSSGFMNLLNSQQDNHIDLEGFSPTTNLASSETFVFSNLDEPTTVKSRRERRSWSIKEDLVLISAWLNTSKDSVVGNEQRAKAFWTRITNYYNSSIAKHPALNGTQPRESLHCKQRWTKINDQVCKFVGCYEAALAQKKSGRNLDDVQKVALDIFFNDHNQKFMLEHAWLELRHDQKWCASNARKAEESSKRRKVEEGSSQTSSCHPEEVEVLGRPAGVKSSKALGKRTVTNKTTVEEGRKDMLQFQNMWDIRQKELSMKDKLSNKKLLECLLSKTEPLSDVDLALKNKLISDLFSV